MLPLVACVLLVVLLGIAVLASMLVENWGRWSVDLTVPASATRTARSTAPTQPAVDETDAAAPIDRELEIAGSAAADRAVAVLFAAYAAERLPEANRVAAWVTSSDWPPSRTGGSYRPGADLRAKPVAVGRLLDCADQGRCWLTLSDRTDIARGLRARPPSCPVLGGLVVVWHATRAAMTRLDPDDVATAAAAVRELAPRWATTTGAPDVEPIAAVLSDAASAGAGVVVRVPLQPLGPGEHAATRDPERMAEPVPAD